MKNIELFDTYTAEVFARLYEAFPVGVHLDAQEISGCPGVDDFGALAPQAEVCRATMEWLRDSGYIRCRDATAYALAGAVLTARGLEALKAMPESLGGKVAVGERIAGLVRTGSMELAREAAKIAISHGVRLVLGG